MTRFFYVLFVLALSLPAWADDVKSPFIFVSEKSIEKDNALEQAAFSTGSDVSTERRKLRERFLDMLGINRFVPHGSFTTFGLKSRWAMAVPDEETVSLKVSMRW